jgi:two-component system phosphate regulon sensor histidine kinase PhoR
MNDQKTSAEQDAVDTDHHTTIVQAASSRLRQEQGAPMTQPASGADEQGDSTNQVMSLLKVSSYLVSVLDPDELLANLVSLLVEALPSVQGGMLWLYDRRVSRLRMVSIYGLPIDAETCTALKNQSFSLGEGLAGQALQNGEPQLTEVRAGYRSSIGRISPSNQAIFQEIDKQLPPVLTDVCIPLRIGNEASGVIELLNLGERSVSDQWQPLRSTDMPVLQTFGNLAATAIKNAQLYSQTQNHRQRLDAFDAVVTAISTATDLHDLVRSVLDVVMGLVPCLAGSILLLDLAQDRLNLGTQQGLSFDYAASLQGMPVAGSSCEEVVRYGQPILRPLLEERGEGALLAAGIASCAYMPLLAGGTVVGVLGLYGDATLYRTVDTATLMPLSNQVGFAIANVRLYDESQIERRKLNTVINSIAEGVVLCDSQGHLVLANEAAMNMLTLKYIPYQQPLSEMPDFYGIRDLEGQPLPVEQLPLALALSGEVFHDYRVLLRGASGYDSVMSFSGSPAYGDDGSIEGAVVVFRDVTAHQKLERAKDEFLAIAAHELRSPLAAVRSYADLLLRREQQRSEVDPREIQGLTILTQQVSHMLQMVDNLLDVSRIDAGQLDLQIQRVNLVSLVSQVLDQQQPSAVNHELILETDYTELWVRCDSLRIHQVLTNLVSNAVKYSPPDTCITVRLSTRPQDETLPAREHRALDNGVPSEVLVEVMDIGGGIPKDQLAQLFRRYYRGKNRRAEGLGLGLYLSRQFILMHGGRIRVESNEGQGSTFAFTLPFEPPMSQCDL